MALSDTSKTLISIKKLVGKAHTSNDKDVANEGLPSGLTVASNTVFGQTIPTTANQTSDALYTILTGSGITGDGQVEYLRFQASFIAGSDTSDGRHGFELKLPADYETNSKNPLAGTYPFKNNQSKTSDLSNQVIFARVDEIIKLNLADEYFNAFFSNKDNSILIFIGEGSKILNKNSIYLEEKFDFFTEISFFEENATLICESGFNFNLSGKFKEVNFFPKKPKNMGFFEKFFRFFN